MNVSKKYFIFFIFFLYTIFNAQTEKKEQLIGDFTYLLKGKIYKSTPNYTYEELFSLQVLNDRALFISEQAIKYDSIFESEFKKSFRSGGNIDLRGKSFPKTKFPYTIVQTNSDIRYFEKVGMALLSYKEPTINNWRLIDESKIINSFKCKKAEVTYKGRNWVAWYSVDIPLPYGPYKFTGLPGLIIKITDQNGDYDFELVKSLSSDNLKDAILTIKEKRYSNAKETTAIGLQEAKNNFINNMIGSLGSTETTIAPNSMETVRNIQKQKQQNMMDENSIEQIK